MKEIQPTSKVFIVSREGVRKKQTKIVIIAKTAVQGKIIPGKLKICFNNFIGLKGKTNGGFTGRFPKVFQLPL